MHIRAQRALGILRAGGTYDESKHERGPDGKFTSGGEGDSASGGKNRERAAGALKELGVSVSHGGDNDSDDYADAPFGAGGRKGVEAKLKEFNTLYRDQTTARAGNEGMAYLERKGLAEKQGSPRRDGMQEWRLTEKGKAFGKTDERGESREGVGHPSGNEQRNAKLTPKEKPRGYSAIRRKGQVGGKRPRGR